MIERFCNRLTLQLPCSQDLMPNVEDLFEEVLESWTDRQLRVVNI